MLGIVALATTPASDSDTIDLKSRNYLEWTASHYTVEAQNDVVEAGVDGESIDFPSPLHFDIRPKALRVLVPKGTKPGYLSRNEARTAKVLDLVQLGGDPETYAQ